jgi:hypothetical protein
MRRQNLSRPRLLQLIAVLLVAAFSLARANAVHLVQGQSVTINIGGLVEERPRLTNSTCQEVAEALVRLRGDFLLPGEVIRMELFENSEAEAPFMTMDRTGLGQGTGAVGTYINTYWQDMQGVMRLTMLSGSVNVDSIYVTIQNNGCGHWTNTIDSPTPPIVDCLDTAVVDCAHDTPLVVDVEDLSGEALTVWWLVNGVAKQTNFIPGVGVGVNSAEVTFVPALPLGQYDVTVLVSNSVSGTTCSTLLTVADLSQPAIFCPPNQVVEFVDALGAPVVFTTEVMDCDTNLTVVSVPTSGSTFPIGTNLVRTTATDGSSNVAACEFTITVLGARGTLSNIVAKLTAIHELETDAKQQRRLADALESLREALESNLFLDETHLRRPAGGKVFRQHQRAYRKLAQWMRSEQDPILIDLVQNCLARLLRSDRLLASVAIRDAVDAEGNATQIAAAQVKLAQGDLAVLRERQTRAIADYRTAWLRAGRAVR